MEKKICKKCGIEKLLVDFCFRKYKKQYRNECKSCRSKYNKRYREENKASAEDYRKNYYSENNIELKKYSKKYYLENNDNIKVKNKIYYEKNKCEIIDKNRIYINERRKNDLTFRLLGNMRSLIRQSIIRKVYKKDSKTINILGCTIDEFRIYLEKKFEPWMNWDNYGKYSIKRKTWQLDHIIPISSAKTEEEIILLNKYTNFQPLESLENILKSNKTYE